MATYIRNPNGSYTITATEHEAAAHKKFIDDNLELTTGQKATLWEWAKTFMQTPVNVVMWPERRINELVNNWPAMTRLCICTAIAGVYSISSATGVSRIIRTPVEKFSTFILTKIFRVPPQVVGSIIRSGRLLSWLSLITATAVGDVGLAVATPLYAPIYGVGKISAQGIWRIVNAIYRAFYGVNAPTLTSRTLGALWEWIDAKDLKPNSLVGRAIGGQNVLDSLKQEVVNAAKDIIQEDINSAVGGISNILRPEGTPLQPEIQNPITTQNVLPAQFDRSRYPVAEIVSPTTNVAQVAVARIAPTVDNPYGLLPQYVHPERIVTQDGVVIGTINRSTFSSPTLQNSPNAFPQIIPSPLTQGGINMGFNPSNPNWIPQPITVTDAQNQTIVSQPQITNPSGVNQNLWHMSQTSPTVHNQTVGEPITDSRFNEVLNPSLRTDIDRIWRESGTPHPQWSQYESRIYSAIRRSRLNQNEINILRNIESTSEWRILHLRFQVDSVIRELNTQSIPRAIDLLENRLRFAPGTHLIPQLNRVTSVVNANPTVVNANPTINQLFEEILTPSAPIIRHQLLEIEPNRFVDFGEGLLLDELTVVQPQITNVLQQTIASTPSNRVVTAVDSMLQRIKDNAIRRLNAMRAGGRTITIVEEVNALRAATLEVSVTQAWRIARPILGRLLGAATVAANISIFLELWALWIELENERRGNIPFPGFAEPIRLLPQFWRELDLWDRDHTSWTRVNQMRHGWFLADAAAQMDRESRLDPSRINTNANRREPPSNEVIEDAVISAVRTHSTYLFKQQQIREDAELMRIAAERSRNLPLQQTEETPILPPGVLYSHDPVVQRAYEARLYALQHPSERPPQITHFDPYHGPANPGGSRPLLGVDLPSTGANQPQIGWVHRPTVDDPYGLQLHPPIVDISQDVRHETWQNPTVTRTTTGRRNAIVPPVQNPITNPGVPLIRDSIYDY